MAVNVSERNGARNSVPGALKIVSQKTPGTAGCLHWHENPLASRGGAETLRVMQSSPGRRALLHRCGAVILFVGICLGAFVYWSAPPSASQSVYDDSMLAPEDSRRYAHDTEVNFGKTGVIGDKAMRTVSRLGEPKPLAITIIVISVLVSGGCFYASRAHTAGE
jgi:hypothetical protein